MIVGIDLGTTNSLVGVCRDGAVELVPNVFGDLLTPSVVGLSDSGEVLVGRAAADRLVTHPQLTAATFKRVMGSEKVFTLGQQHLRPQELSALVLKSLLRDVEAYLGRSATEAVISVPAYFNDTQRQATAAAGEIAGVHVERLINEPTAAALAYRLNDRGGEGTFLVFDVGGGTFDVSVLETFHGIMEVHASAGDNFLGGEDFVDVIVGLFETKTQVEELAPAERATLRAAAERAKRGLNSADVTMRILRDGRQVQCTITRDEYRNAVDPLLQRLRAPVERALRDAQLRVTDLDEVVMVGGSTRKSVIQALVARMFGRLPLRHIDPDEVVARGAAVQAALKMRDAALEDVVLTDVCPYTLGIEVADDPGNGHYVTGVFSPILERNTIVPTSRVERYHPVDAGQRKIELRVYQGESRRVADNVFLGKLDVRLPRGLPIDRSGVDVRFTYDVNGILEVLTTVEATQEERRLVISRDAGMMSEAEIAEALSTLSDLKIHPRDQDENAATLNRALRAYEEHIGAQRDAIGHFITRFEAALARQEPREIRAIRSELQRFLDDVDRDSVL